jgi:hypothetical protein
LPEIAADPEKVYDYTNKWNTVIVVSDGTRVLGLGDIGPKAGLPVMEGKALLYKYLGGVDGIPIMLDTKDPDAIINTVLMLQPGFGGVNLEDISNPKCFYILDTLREKAEIPVWHDDQQGTATVTLAGLINALKVVNKKMSEVSIAFIGTGASNVACSRLIFGWGADPGKCFMVDTKGILGNTAKTWRCAKLNMWTSGDYAILPTMKAARVISRTQCGRRCGHRPVKIWSGRDLAGMGQSMGKDSIVFACAPTRFLKFGHGRPKRPGRGWSLPGVLTSPTRSTTRLVSPASSAALWTCALAPLQMRCALPQLMPWRPG